MADFFSTSFPQRWKGSPAGKRGGKCMSYLDLLFIYYIYPYFFPFLPASPASHKEIRVEPSTPYWGGKRKISSYLVLYTVDIFLPGLGKKW
jgi:hypothetical protein